MRRSIGIDSACCARAGVRPGLGRLAALVVCAWVAVWGVGVASGQAGGDAGAGDAADGGPGGGSGGREADLSVLVPRVDSGVGGTVVRGEWAGFRVRLRSVGGEAAREVAVRLRVVDVDGDGALYERFVTLTGDRERSAWVYAPVGLGAEDGGALVVSVHEVDAETGRVGGLIGSGRAPLRRVVGGETELIGLVGSSSLGLGQYELAYPGRAESRVGSSHGVFGLVRGLLPEDLPDRWLGLAGFSTLVWGERSPADLTEAQAEALREWVLRGGHLVVVLPAVSDVWMSASDNPLFGVLPEIEVRRVDGVDLELYRGVLTRPEYAGFELPGSVAVQTVEPTDGSTAREAGCVIAGPDGCVVAKGAYGSGAVTVVGLPVGLREVQGAGVFRADVFWHRLLGQRFEIPSPRQLADDEFATKVGTDGSIGEPFWVDQFVPRLIGRSGAAAAGVLLALVVFVGYWLLAGPVGFALLKRRGAQRYAWVAFVLTTAAFAVVAWVGAQSISPRTASVTHLTVVDHVFGERLHRVRSWATVLMPTYGDRAVGLRESETSLVRRVHNAMFAWADPGGATSLRFPDARDYVVSSAGPDALTVPSRGTVKQFRGDWLGPGLFETPVPVVGGEPRFVGSGRSGESALEGGLVHNLPAALRDVRVYLVLGPRGVGAVGRDLGGQPANERFGVARSRVHAFSLSGDVWEAGRALDLASLVPQVPGTLIDGGMVGDAASLMGGVRRLSLRGVMAPPDFFDAQSAFGGPSQALLRSRLASTMDLSHWTSQPCLIVIGRMDVAEMSRVDRPGLFVTPGDGGSEALPLGEGTVVLRWVYVLGERPLTVGVETAGAAGGGGS